MADSEQLESAVGFKQWREQYHLKRTGPVHELYRDEHHHDNQLTKKRRMKVVFTCFVAVLLVLASPSLPAQSGPDIIWTTNVEFPSAIAFSGDSTRLAVGSPNEY